MTRRDSVIRALVHTDSIGDHYQAMRALGLPHKVVDAIGKAQQAVLSIADDIRAWSGMAEKRGEAIYLPAFPKSAWKLLANKKQRESWRHL